MLIQADIMSSTIHLATMDGFPNRGGGRQKYLDENKMMHESHLLWGMAGQWGVLLVGGEEKIHED